MCQNAHVIPGTSVGWRQVCLHGHHVCCLGSVKGPVHLHTETQKKKKNDGRSASVIQPL